MTLANKQCVPCRKGEPVMPVAEANELVKKLAGWSITEDGKRLAKFYDFDDFAGALDFVNQVGLLAEAQNHHPDIAMGWGYVKLELMTHAIRGLHLNDFILAAKIDAM